MNTGHRSVLRACRTGDGASPPHAGAAHSVYAAVPPQPPAASATAAVASGAAAGAPRAGWATPERLAARLSELEKKLAPDGESGQGSGDRRGCYGGFGSVLGRTGDAGGLASAAVDDVQVTLGGTNSRTEIKLVCASLGSTSFSRL